VDYTINSEIVSMSALNTKIFKKKVQKIKKLEEKLEEKDKEIADLKQKLEAQMKIALVYMEAMKEAQKVEREVDEICSRIQIDPEDSIDHLIGKVPT